MRRMMLEFWTIKTHSWKRKIKLFTEENNKIVVQNTLNRITEKMPFLQKLEEAESNGASAMKFSNHINEIVAELKITCSSSGTEHTEMEMSNKQAMSSIHRGSKALTDDGPPITPGIDRVDLKVSIGVVVGGTPWPVVLLWGVGVTYFARSLILWVKEEGLWNEEGREGGGVREGRAVRMGRCNIIW